MTPLFIGGEMPHWSDREPVAGVVLHELVASAHGHTLVVGPHDPALIEAVPARHVTVLVRGVPDAEALATRFAGRPGFEVCCGSLEKLAAVPAYDTVIALDGLDRTGSTETADISWAAGFSLLMAVLRPGGRLMLGMDNQVGLHRLLACAPAPGDADWAAPVDDDPTRPTGPSRLNERIRDGGLTLLRAYAAHPSPQAPSVLLSDTVLDAPELDGWVSGVLRRAGTAGRPLLADPRPVAVQMLRHGLGADLAPGWVVVAAHGGWSGVALPEAVVAAGPVPHRLSRVASGSAHGPARWVRTGGTGGQAEPVPAGRCLHDLLIGAVRAHDMPRLRALLAAWQGGSFAGMDADAVIIDPEGRLHAAGGDLSGPREAGATLRRFAGAVQDEGLAHLWPSPADEIGTARLLAAMAGVEVDLTAADSGTTGSGTTGSGTTGSGEAGSDGAPVRPRPQDLRELIAANDRLARELSEVRAQAIWYEERLAARDTELTRAYRIISLLKGTVPGRAATAVRGALRTGKRAARTALNRIQPQR